MTFQETEDASEAAPSENKEPAKESVNNNSDTTLEQDLSKLEPYQRRGPVPISSKKILLESAPPEKDTKLQVIHDLRTVSDDVEWIVSL